MDKLVGDDKIVATVTYTVLDEVVSTKTYTWTLVIPPPHLTDARYNPGNPTPANFDDRRFDYILDLPQGGQATETIISKTEGALDLKITHDSVVAGEVVTICEDCDFDTVRHSRCKAQSRL